MVRTVILQCKRIPELNQLHGTQMGDFLYATLFAEDIAEQKEVAQVELWNSVGGSAKVYPVRLFIGHNQVPHLKVSVQGGTFESECIGLGDLYVTIFSGRTRRCGVLMGQGLNYDEVTEALAGITLESLVITRVMGQAIRRKAELGLVDLKDFPLLMHIVDILDKGKADADLPWEAFIFEHLK